MGVDFMENSPDTYNEKLEAIIEGVLANNLDTSISSVDDLRSKYPDRPHSYYLLGLISFRLGEPGKALRFMEEGIKISPTIIEFPRALAALSAKTGNLSDMNYYLKLTLMTESDEFLARVEPHAFANPEQSLERVDLPVDLVNAWVCFHERSYAKALDYCTKYLEIKPDDAEARQLSGKLHLELGQPVKALNALRRANEISPLSIEYAFDLSEAYLSVGEYENARATLLKHQHKHEHSIQFHQALVRVGIMASTSHLGASDLNFDRNVLRRLLEKVEIAVPENHISPTKKNEKICVGILINEQAMKQSIDFIDAWFQAHDSDEIRIVGYQQFERAHAGTPRLKNLIHDWRECHDLDDVTFKHILSNDGLDVLIDVCGINPGNRQRLLASEIEACRVGWLQGCDAPIPEALDFIISDDVTNAKDKAVAPISLGIGQLAYGGGSVLLETFNDKDIAEKRTNPVFGAVFDPSALIHSIHMWSEVLHTIPDSELILGRADMIEVELIDYFVDRFRAAGLNDRIKFVAGDAGRNGWAELLSQVDVLLDSAAADGTTSTCDALWMGVPVISLSTDSAKWTFGPSILTAAGCGEWIASDEQTFVKIAKDLVSIRADLNQKRYGLRDKIKNSHLCDLNGFADRMKTALHGAINQRGSIKER